MDRPVTDLDQLLRTLEPVRNEGAWAFALLPPGTDPGPLEPAVTVREPEGLTVVVPEAAARAHGLTVLFRGAWITLRVHSDLQAVGLTAAVAGELGRAGISCNVVAGACHDHLFVPLDQAGDALEALRALQRRSQDGAPVIPS
jgi:hypothetical protein